MFLFLNLIELTSKLIPGINASFVNTFQTKISSFVPVSDQIVFLALKWWKWMKMDSSCLYIHFWTMGTRVYVSLLKFYFRFLVSDGILIINLFRPNHSDVWGTLDEKEANVSEMNSSHELILFILFFVYTYVYLFFEISISISISISIYSYQNLLP